jgi:hypothetical protein
MIRKGFSPMSDIQQQINARIEAFVSEVSALARQAAMEALSNALDQTGARKRGVRAATTNGVALARTPRRKGAKRSPNEIQGTIAALEAHIAANPGQRMEEIATALHVGTKDLTLPIKKLLASKAIKRQGQKRATRYFPAEGGAPRGAARAAASGARKPRRAKRRAKKA